MSNFTTLALAVGLAMDAFTVALAVGASLTEVSFRHYFRLAFHFGLFQFLMPILGWFLGRSLHAELSAYDHWLAFILLFLVGAKLLYDSIVQPDEKQPHQGPKDPTRKWSLLSLSVATSIDALAVGLSVALLDVGIVYPSMAIGLVALIFTIFGLYFGQQIGKWIGKAAGIFGGLLLIAIGTKILIGDLQG